jgi:hypothetical protein
MEVKTANEKGGIRQIHSQFTTEHSGFFDGVACNEKITIALGGV